MLRRLANRVTALPSFLLFAFLYAAVALSHLTLLRLPYFWDEGGYYIPAALDFYHYNWLVPHFTNAHPPLPNVVLGTLWHLTGFHILATRLIVCAFAAAALLAVLRLTQRLLNPTAALAVTLLTAVYPIWYAQSTLAHADIFAATFTLWAFALYLPHISPSTGDDQLETANWRLETESKKPSSQTATVIATAALFTFATLSKETAILEPATLAAFELYLLIRHRRLSTRRREHLRWLAALSFPLLPLIAWYAWHHHVTGFTFGNPEYLRYNATANFTAGHIFTSLRYRFLHLFWQRNIWLPLVLALASLFLPARPPKNSVILSEGPEQEKRAEGTQPKDPDDLRPIPTASTFSTSTPAAANVKGASQPAVPCFLFPVSCLILSNWLAFSILGGALLTRYLLPIYPLLLILCVYTWQSRTRLAPLFTAITAAAFVSAWWLNPPTSFAPEDNLTYRDMVVVHQQAIDYVAQHYPNSTVLSAWPVTADLFNPYLGYVTTPIKAVSVEDFTRPSLQTFVAETANTHIASYDTAIVFTTHFLEPNLRHYLLTHPNTPRGREFAATRDLSPQEIATLLGGTVVATYDRHGEWAAVLRFNRSYEARISPQSPLRP